MPRRLAQQRMTLSDLEWPFHASHAISAVAELHVLFQFLLFLYGLAEFCQICKYSARVQIIVENSGNKTLSRFWEIAVFVGYSFLPHPVLSVWMHCVQLARRIGRDPDRVTFEELRNFFENAWNHQCVRHLVNRPTVFSNLSLYARLDFLFINLFMNINVDCSLLLWSCFIPIVNRSIVFECRPFQLFVCY